MFDILSGPGVDTGRVQAEWIICWSYSVNLQQSIGVWLRVMNKQFHSAVIGPGSKGQTRLDCTTSAHSQRCFLKSRQTPVCHRTYFLHLAFQHALSSHLPLEAKQTLPLHLRLLEALSWRKSFFCEGNQLIPESTYFSLFLIWNFIWFLNWAVYCTISIAWNVKRKEDIQEQWKQWVSQQILWLKQSAVAWQC